MNVDTLIHQYFPSAENVCIEMFDEKNIQQVYRRLVEVLIHQPEVETSLLQGMSYCFYEVMDNVLIHSGKNVGIVITNYSESQHLIQILVADDGIGIRESLAQNAEYGNITEQQALEYCIRWATSRPTVLTPRSVCSVSRRSWWAALPWTGRPSEMCSWA